MLSPDACAIICFQASRRAERDDQPYFTINPEKKPEVLAVADRHLISELANAIQLAN